MMVSGTIQSGGIIRRLTPDDASAYGRFASQVPDGERCFLKERLSDSTEVFGGFLHDGDVSRLAAVHRFAAISPDGDIAGIVGIFVGAGWSSHVAELRVLVAPRLRRHGTDRALAARAVAESRSLGCTHIYVEVIAKQNAIVTMFQELDFEPEALLADFVRDNEGILHNLMLLTHRVEDSHERNHTYGLDEVIA